MSERFSLEALAERIPMRRLGLPKEVAAVVALPGSGGASHATGQATAVDGGIV